MNQVSEDLIIKFVLMKRETGENPVRTRHRNKGAKPTYHWETGKMVNAIIFKPGDLPDLSTKQMLKPRVTGCTCESVLIFFIRIQGIDLFVYSLSCLLIALFYILGTSSEFPSI